MCQDCVEDGVLSQETFDKIEHFIELWPDSEFGPGHVALSDCNVRDVDINGCLSDETWARMSDGHAHDELEATRAFLQSLLLTPENER